MNNSFNIARGVFPVKVESGELFEPKAGYKLQLVSDKKWDRVYKIACSVDQIESLVNSFVDVCLPESIYFIINVFWGGDIGETYLSPFLPCSRIEKSVKKCTSLLNQDGMVGYGFAWYDEDFHEEIFVDDHKEITIFTSKGATVDLMLSQHSLQCIEELHLLSEHGHGHTNIAGSEDTSYRQLIRELEMKKH